MNALVGLAKAGINAALAALCWGWNKVSAAGNYVIDPPPVHIKFAFWVVLAVVLGSWLAGDLAVSWVKHQMYWAGIPPQHQRAIPLIGGVPVMMPVSPKAALPQPPAKPEAIIPLPPAKAAPAPTIIRRAKVKRAAPNSAEKWPF